jgi:predicted AAA+ superfamily ATPase
MAKTIKRRLDSIDYMRSHFPCLALIGARQVGKTTIMKGLKNGDRIFDLEKHSDFELISRDAEFFLKTEKPPIAIDEAQIHPPLFPALRVFIDENRSQNGQVFISGSSSPQLINSVTESLAGRVGVVEVNTLTLAEIEGTELSPFYEALVKTNVNQLSNLKLKNRDWRESVWWGGYPEVILKSDIQFKRIWSEQYIQTYIDRDIRRLFPDLQIEKYQQFIRMLAFSSGEIINYAEWSSALGTSEPTVKKYLEIAQGTFLFRKYPAYSFHPTKRLMKSPKGVLCDTGLLTALLRIDRPEDLFHHPRVGLIFEVFCLEQIVKSLKLLMINFEAYHYRTKQQQEIDLILDFSKHKIPIEIKLGSTVRSENLKTISTFVAEEKCPFGIIINNSDVVCELAPKIYQIPFACL